MKIKILFLLLICFCVASFYWRVRVEQERDPTFIQQTEQVIEDEGAQHQ